VQIRQLRGRSRLAFVMAVAVCLALIPLGGPVLANHDQATLDVEPDENGDDPASTGDTYTLTAEITQSNTATAINIDFENEDGVNDTDGTNYDNGSDLSCNVPAGGQTCTVSYVGTNEGEDTWRSWIDHDKVSTTVEADMDEQQNENLFPGLGSDECPGQDPLSVPPNEPDCTDVVTVTWEVPPPGSATTLDCDDANGPDTENETNPHNGDAASEETYTCTARDQTGSATNEPPEGQEGTSTVFGENESGVNDPDNPDAADSYDEPDYTCEVGDTDDGQCEILVTQSEGETGTAEICFWLENEEADRGDEECNDEPTGTGPDSGDDLADQVEKTWAEREADNLDAEPETDTNDLGDQHTITATVFDQFGDKFQTATTVNFEFFSGSPSDGDGTSPGSPDDSCNTGNDGDCSIGYTQTETAGTDRICAWINQTPTMSSGNCDGESLNDPDDQAGQPDPQGQGQSPRDDQDVVQKTWLGEGAASRLDCTPETDDNQTGTGHTVTCTATNKAGQTVSGANIDAEATGAGDADGNTPTSPDFTCTTQTGGANAGRCSFTHTSNASGTTTYRAWIDSDNSNESADADPNEGLNDNDNDNTDVVQKNWAGGPATRLDCSPETDSNQTGSSHTVTCTTTESTNQTVSGTNVDAEATGAGDPDAGDSQNSPDFTCTTGSNGSCTFTHTSSAAGTTTYRAWIDASGNNQTSEADQSEGLNDNDNDNTDVVEKTWTGAPPPPAACSNGVDDDGDGKIDHPDDPGCSSPDDTTETGTFRRASRVTIRHRFSPHVFKGRVSSGPARCERGRTVVVKEVRAGRDAVEGRDRTNREGRWREPHDRFGAGRYYAKVLRKRFTNRFGDTIICRADRSDTIRVRR